MARPCRLLQGLHKPSQTSQPFPEFILRRGIRQPNVLAPTARAKVISGRQRHMGFLQRAFAELHGVQPGGADINVNIEGPIG